MKKKSYFGQTMENIGECTNTKLTDGVFTSQQGKHVVIFDRDKKATRFIWETETGCPKFQDKK